MRYSIRLATIAMLLLCLVGAPVETAIAQENVEGTVYTSPTFGYQLQWSDPWMFIEEDTDTGIDYLLLSTGAADASILLGFSPGITVDDLVAIAIENPQPGASNIQPMLDAQGNPVRGTQDAREWAMYTGTQDLGDGTSVEFMQYFSVQPLGQGVVLLMTITTVSFFWDDTTLASWNDLADTILVGAPGPAVQPTPDLLAPTATASDVTPPQPAPITETAEPLSPDTRQGSGEGEPAPAFAAGPWRIAVRAVDLGETIDYLGLGFVDGQQWIVVYADVTNWSGADAQLDVAGWQLVPTSGLVAPDVAGTQSTASLLGLEPANGSSVTVPAGTSIRVSLVYSIPASETELILEVAGTQLPLADAVGRQFDVTDLSTIATPPPVVEGTLRVLPDDGSGQPHFVADTGSGETSIHLAGVDFTEQSGCTAVVGDKVEIKLDFGGSQAVLLESDPTVSDSGAYYVWLDDGAGSRTLLNQSLIASGMALEGDLPDAARFGAWLEQSEELARSNSVGIWQLCA